MLPEAKREDHVSSSSLHARHEALCRASAAFSRGITRARLPADGTRPSIAHLIIAKHAIESELSLLDGAFRTLARGCVAAHARTN